MLLTMTVMDFTRLSPRNAEFEKEMIEVANGTTFVVLVMGDEQKKRAANVLYIHVNRENRKCYIGITIQEAAKRWFTGTTYKLNRRFGRALEKYGWGVFDSYIVAFAEDRDALSAAEVEAIAAAGGHKSRLTYNLSPGGDLVADNNIPIVGIYLPTGEERRFVGGAEAARVIGFRNSSTPMAVINGSIHTAKGWWFRLAHDSKSQPPLIWGKKYKDARMRESKARPLVAINYATGEVRSFETADDAAAALGVQQSEVWAVAHRKAHSAGGWWFKFDGDDREMPKLRGAEATRAKRDRKVFALHLKTGERRDFRNCTVADKELELHKGAAASVASGERASAADWWFSFDPNASPPTEFGSALVAKARSKAVVATEIATGIERRFESALVAATELGMSRALISYSISGKRLSAKGYRFRFA